MTLVSDNIQGDGPQLPDSETEPQVPAQQGDPEAPAEQGDPQAPAEHGDGSSHDRPLQDGAAMLTAVYHFGVSELWVKSELLGTRHNTIFNGHNIVLILPGNGIDFGTSKNGGYPLGGYTMHSGSEEMLAAEILMIRVEIQVEGDLKGMPRDSDSRPSQDVLLAGLEILRQSVEIAREFAKNYIALVRTNLDQYWLGPSESELRLAWISQLLDSDGNVIPVGYSDPMPVSWHSTDNALSADVNQLLIQEASEGVQPDLADSFLRDAEYTAYKLRDPNLHQAVVLAAIACEIKVKDVITSLASDEQKPLVDLLLENPRDVSLAASSLFDKGMSAVCNRSLLKEDKNLWKQVDLLFQDRNKIAHKGGKRASPDDVLRQHITSAKAAFNWLNGVQSAANVKALSSVLPQPQDHVIIVPPQ
jgi:hypothetical protein